MFETKLLLVMFFVSVFSGAALATERVTEKSNTNDNYVNVAKTSPWYLGAKAGYSYFSSACEEQNINCDSSGFGGGLFLGYRFNDWLSIEGGYDYLGQVEADYPALGNSSQIVNYDATAQGLELGLKADYVLTNNIVLFAKGGVLGWRTETQGQELSYSVDETEEGASPMLGGGLEYHFSKNWVSRLEYQWFGDVGGDNTGGADVNLISVGISYQFGGAKSVPMTAPKPTVIEKYTEIFSEHSGGLLFELNSAKLSQSRIASLQPILKRLRTHPQSQLTIVGHTDERGTEAYNQILSEQRAQSVANYLINEGVSPNQITVSGMGELRPVVDNSTVSGRAANRRVEFSSPAFTVN